MFLPVHGAGMSRATAFDCFGVQHAFRAISVPEGINCGASTGPRACFYGGCGKVADYGFGEEGTVVEAQVDSR